MPQNRTLIKIIEDLKLHNGRLNILVTENDGIRKTVITIQIAEFIKQINVIWPEFIKQISEFDEQFAKIAELTKDAALALLAFYERLLESHGVYGADLHGMPWHEFEMIVQYLSDYDINPLAEMLEHDPEITPSMRQFISDVMRGKIKKKRGNKSDFVRDFAIYRKIEAFLSIVKLTSNWHDSGAATIVGERYGIDESAAKKARGRIIKLN